jgi:ribosomal protein S3AE
MSPGETTDTQLEGGAVNVYQVSQEEIIRELAQHIVQENLSEMKVRDIARALVNTASNATSGVSRLLQF